MLWLSIEVNLIYVLYTTFRAPTEVTLLDHQCVFGCGSESLVCKIPLLARALGLKAKRARDDRVSCIQLNHLTWRRVKMLS